KAIHQEVVIDASPEQIYEAYMDSAKHAEFTANGEATISRDAGGEFSCHGGAISGRNIELVPNERIVQACRVMNWEPGVYSVVIMELVKEGEKTKVVLDHDGFPEGEAEQLGPGWHARYWVPLKNYFA